MHVQLVLVNIIRHLAAAWPQLAPPTGHASSKNGKLANPLDGNDALEWLLLPASDLDWSSNAVLQWQDASEADASKG